MDFNFFMKTSDYLKIIETVDIEDCDYSKILFYVLRLILLYLKLKIKVNSEMSRS